MQKINAHTIAASVLIMLLVCVPVAQAQSFINETFTGTTAPEWTFVNAAGDGPRLTAASGIDPAGSGWLRLTSDKTYQNSFVYYNNPITTNYGFTLTFDFVIWTADRTNVADGFAVVLWDGRATPSPGGWGGSLGYAQHNGFGSIGMNGGFTAFGFDSYGNFSNPTEERKGGPGFRPNSIVLRGSMGADRYQGYEYLTGAHNLTAFSKLNAKRRSQATVYNVILTMSTDSKITIQMRAAGGTWVTRVNAYQTPLVYPDQVMIGFTASTGAYTSTQELRNFVVTPIEEPECWVDEDCPTGFGCLGYVCETATLIELGSFDATWEDGENDAVAINWVTETEIDNSYFNLYRAESIKTARKGGFKKNSKKGLMMGPYVKINADPIPALGESPFGASYEFIDTDVKTGKRYWYKLEDVDLYGTETDHGPCGPVSAWEDCSYMP